MVYPIGFLETTFYMLYFVWPVGPRVHLFALIVSFLVIPNADSFTSSIFIFFRTFQVRFDFKFCYLLVNGYKPYAMFSVNTALLVIRILGALSW